MVPEAALEQTEAGLAPVGEGWFVVNAREARWRHRPGRGSSVPFSVEEETNDATVAYARFPETEPTRYRDGWLPGF